ncbi:unnamed protein product [Menidia menidia]|uniref:(Atlantic silverside) hypothetical protein n=1 Tax=Menidia menidia TaxID=238744 RepID=A0A8S4A8K5_9TELE|nr:unnamed protein product [Menidia menidia]
MTLEEVVGSNSTDKKMETVTQALEELLVAAQRQDGLTVGVYESAKLMNVDPDSVVLCVLATDEEDEDDIALQIHFTLLQAFCCDNDINILRVSGMRRLAQLLGEDTEDSNGNEPRDLHCILVTVKPAGAAAAVPGSEGGQQLLRGEPLHQPVGALPAAAGPLSPNQPTPTESDRRGAVRKRWNHPNGQSSSEEEEELTFERRGGTRASSPSCRVDGLTGPVQAA